MPTLIAIPIGRLPPLLCALAMALALPPSADAARTESTVTTPSVTTTTYTPTTTGPVRTTVSVTPEVIAHSEAVERGVWLRDHAALLTALAALLIAIIPGIVGVLRRPRFDLHPPTKDDDIVPGAGESLYWIRLRVTNSRRRRTAQDVEVVVAELERTPTHGEPRAVGPLTGRGLPWVHADANRKQRRGEAGLITIAPGSARYLSLLACRGYDATGQPLTKIPDNAILWDPVLLARPRPEDRRFHLGLPDGIHPKDRAAHFATHDDAELTAAPAARVATSGAALVEHDDLVPLGPAANDDALPAGPAAHYDAVSESRPEALVATAAVAPVPNAEDFVGEDSPPGDGLEVGSGEGAEVFAESIWTYRLVLVVTARDAPARRFRVMVGVPAGLRASDGSAAFRHSGGVRPPITIEVDRCRWWQDVWAWGARRLPWRSL